jgi:hypothetical protein
MPESPNQPDLQAKPVFALHVWCGGEGAKATYEPWDTMHVSDDEWERCVTTARIYSPSETDDSLSDLRPTANKSTTVLSKYVGTLSVNIGA